MGLLRHILLLSAFLLPGVLLAQEEADYDRSSLHIMMIKPLNAKYGDAVESVFRKMPFPERFNDHNLGVKCISFAETGKDQTHNLKVFIERTNIAQKMVAKWFNRDKRTGSFNMELIKERGTYNANLGERMEARKSLRGLALLEDAGELLLNHTYLLVNDITYQSKGSGSWLFSTLAGNFGAIQNINGFQVTVRSYLFHLKWNENLTMDFYKNYYTEDATKEPEKVKAFLESGASYEMELVGDVTNTLTEKQFRKLKDPETFLMMVTKRTIDANIADLQRAYPDFRIKAPLLSNMPLKADVGVKEGIREDSKFEVLERVVAEDGRMTYERVGLIRPVKGKIKDNRFMVSEEESADALLDATEFEIISGKDFLPGMLIREVY